MGTQKYILKYTLCIILTRRFGRPTAALLLAPAEGWGPFGPPGHFGPCWGPSAPSPSFLPKKNPKKKKSKMAAMLPKWLPVVDMGVISLSSEFQPCSSSNGCDMDNFTKSKMAAKPNQI